MTPVQRTVTATVVALIAMTGFTIALVPLYDVFCQLTGLNGKVAGQSRPIQDERVVTERYITVQFVTRTSAGLPWRLESLDRQVRVHPGQSYEALFTFKNHGARAYWGRAVPSVSPSEASLHLRKVTCFCFQEQRLAAGERMQLPLVFQLSPDIPAGIHTVTLAYTLYPLADKPVLGSRSLPTQGGDA